MAGEFNTRRYEASHGKKPRGRGLWAFRFFVPDPYESREVVEFAPSNLMYSDAKKWAYSRACELGSAKFIIDVQP